MKDAFLSFCTALRFLTLIPVLFGRERDAEFFLPSVRFFVLVGLLIGLIAYALASLLGWLLPFPLLCAVLLLFLSGISGFLHLDAVADCGDGFLSARPKERILEIMKDSRIGAMGVISLILLFLFKFVALFSLPHEQIGQVVLLMPLTGRAALIISMRILPYARKEGGIGELFYVDSGISGLAWSLFFYLLALIWVPFSFLCTALVTLFVVTFFFSWWCRKKIGGATGDTLGTVCELSETCTALIFAVVLHVCPSLV